MTWSFEVMRNKNEYKYIKTIENDIYSTINTATRYKVINLC